jgi:biotin--protein ligase
MIEPSIAVYHDRGSGEFSRGALTAALAAHFGPALSVRRITAAEIAASDAWHARTLLLALPGGADRPYCEALAGAGNASIMRYLHGGGAFFGVCAGAYYASARIAFELGTAAGVASARELALFAGSARGSLHELAAPYALDHLRCAAVARVREPGAERELAALYWGGPEFVPDPGASFTPLLQYVSAAEQPALAAVRVQVGRGRAVLTGVHAEVRGEQFPIEVSRFADDSFEHGMRVSATLTGLEHERQAVWNVLLGALGFAAG